MNEPHELDLIVLTADKNTKFAVQGLLGRPADLGIRPIARNVLVHPRRDPGVLKESHDFLRPFLKRAGNCLVMLDREGCGSNQTRDNLEQLLETRLSANGWAGRSAAIVIDPELEVWVWGSSPDVDAVLGWPCKGQDLQLWIAGRFTFDRYKPVRPKEAMEKALYEARTSRSSALYQTLAERARLQHCADPAFSKFRALLNAWFPADPQLIAQEGSH